MSFFIFQLALIIVYLTIGVTTLNIYHGELQAIDAQLEVLQVLSVIIPFTQLIIKIGFGVYLIMNRLPFLIINQPSFSRLFELLKINEFKIETKSMQPDNFDLNFNNIIFYDANGNKENMKANILKIKEKSKIAIFDNKNEGYQSIKKLLLDNTLKYDGSVTLGNVDLREIHEIDRYKYIAYVDDSSEIYPGTILENFLVLKNIWDEKDEEKRLDLINQKLKVAQAYNYINHFEDKLNHQLLIEGKNLSGGQKQRLLIARALAKNTPILILDHATNSIDKLTEQIIIIFSPLFLNRNA